MKFLLFPAIIFLVAISNLSAQQIPLTTTSTSNSKLYEITCERAKIEDNPIAEQAYHPKLIEASSDFYPDFNGMGYYYLENQQLDKAEDAFKTYLAIAPNMVYYTIVRKPCITSASGLPWKRFIFLANNQRVSH